MSKAKPSTDLAIPDDIKLPVAAEQRGIAPHQWNVFKNVIFRGAAEDTVLVALDYCKARGLNPLKKPVHIVQTWNPETKRMEDSIWEGIASHRIEATRSGDYAGKDKADWGEELTLTIEGRSYIYPEWCQITIYKMVQGEARPFPGPRCYFREFYASKKGGHPNAMWARKPRYMLEKCAEAAALRGAFPEELGGRPTAEEMEGQEIGPDHARDVTPPRPKIADFKPDEPAHGEDLDAEHRRATTGYVGDEPEEPKGEEPKGEPPSSFVSNGHVTLFSSDRRAIGQYQAGADYFKAVMAEIENEKDPRAFVQLNETGASHFVEKDKLWMMQWRDCLEAAGAVEGA